MTKSEQLWELLRPYIKEHPLKKDTVLEEDVEGLIDFAEGFGVEDELIRYVQDHPNDDFWSFLTVIPRGLAPNDDGEGIIFDDEDEE